jgi:hypothetical protein
MSEFKLCYEHFLATTRDHFFAGKLDSTLPEALSDDAVEDHPGASEHRLHAGA